MLRKTNTTAVIAVINAVQKVCETINAKYELEMTEINSENSQLCYSIIFNPNLPIYRGVFEELCKSDVRFSVLNNTIDVFVEYIND